MRIQVVTVRTDLLPEGGVMSGRHMPLHNHNISVCATSLVACSFAVHGFNSGHFVGASTALPIQVAMAADTRALVVVPCSRSTPFVPEFVVLQAVCSRALRARRQKQLSPYRFGYVYVPDSPK